MASSLRQTIIALTITCAALTCAALAMARPDLSLWSIAATLFSPLPSAEGQFRSVEAQVIFRASDGQSIDASIWLPSAARGGRIQALQLPCSDVFAEVSPPETARPFPVVIYVPGYNGSKRSSATLLSNLSSHGYVVVGIDDLAHIAIPDQASADERDARVNLFDLSSEQSWAASLARGNLRVRLQSERIRETLDHLEGCAKAAGGAWQGRIDANNAGVVGESFGGAAGAEASMADARIRAIVNIDGALFGDAAAGLLVKPYLVIGSDYSAPSQKQLESARRWEFRQNARDLQHAIREGGRHDGYAFQVTGAHHGSFGDDAFRVSEARHWLKLAPHRARQILNAYILDFLDCYLRNGRGDLIRAGASPYPEVRRVK